MNEKSLLSLREIAGELNLKYKLVLSIRNHMREFLPGLFDSRSAKYFPDCTEIIRLISALREEGYTFIMIREILLKKRAIINDPLINEWASDCIHLYSHYWMDTNELEQTRTDLHGLECSSMDLNVPECSSMDSNVPVCSSLDMDAHGCSSMDADGLACTSIDQSKPVQIGIDQNILLQSVSAMVKDMVSEMSSSQEQILLGFVKNLQYAFQKMATEANIAITALCEASEEIVEGVLSVDSRLSRLEEDLDVGKSEPLELYRVDAGKYQVSLPVLELPRPEIISAIAPEDTQDTEGLALVRRSIENSKPDKNAVRQWVVLKRKESPQPSYNRLAVILNDEKIPTLSGRDAWSRSTVRNLLVREENDEEG